MYTFATGTEHETGQKEGRKVRPIDESLCSKKFTSLGSPIAFNIDCIWQYRA